MSKMNSDWFAQNASIGARASRASSLYLEESSDLRRFTVFGPAASGKTEAMNQEALEQLRAYITADLEATDQLRKTLLPPTLRAPTIIQVAVRFVLLNWNKVWK